jgi:poly-gamma-glutamate synthesis protein (capsule biosynthesis protein)
MRGRAAFAFVALLGCPPAGDGARPSAPATPSAAAASQPASQSSASASTAAPAAAAQPQALPARSETLELTFVGDVIFGRYRASGFDPIPEGEHAVFADIATKLASDVVVGNLETPLVRELPATSPIGSKYSFGASPEHAKHLVAAGFTAVSLANNHWYDMRREGIEQTPEILGELGIVALGAARSEPPIFRIETLEKNGWKIGFCAITTRTNAPLREGVPSLPYLDTRAIREQIVPVLQAAREQHDLVIVLVHWGEEYAESPSVAQVRAAHAMIDAGADLVIGHHPHVLQAIERLDRGLVAYSLGNFLFENTQDIPRLTGVLRVRFRGRGCIERTVFHPAYIARTPVKHPVPATEGMGKRVRGRVVAQSQAFTTRWNQEGEDLVLDSPPCTGGGR